MLGHAVLAPYLSCNSLYSFKFQHMLFLVRGPYYFCIFQFWSDHYNFRCVCVCLCVYVCVPTLLTPPLIHSLDEQINESWSILLEESHIPLNTSFVLTLLPLIQAADTFTEAADGGWRVKGDGNVFGCVCVCVCVCHVCVFGWISIFFFFFFFFFFFLWFILYIVSCYLLLYHLLVVLLISWPFPCVPLAAMSSLVVKEPALPLLPSFTLLTLLSNCSQLKVST